MRRALVTNHQRKAMRALRAQGLTAREIQQSFPQWCIGTITQHVRGVLPARGVPVAEGDKAAMRQMRVDGLTIEAIHTNFPQFHYLTVMRVVRGVQPQCPVARSSRKVDPLTALRLREVHGVTFRTIANRFSVSVPAAFQAYRKAEAVQQRDEARL